jgi:alpha-1,3-rhamnosyl/mannosyltransferase
MKVLYNAIQLIPPLTGIGVYSKHIAEQVALLDGVEEVQFFLGGKCGQLEELFESAPAPHLASGRKLPLHKKIQHALLLRYSLREALNGIYHYIPVLNGPVTRALEQLESRQRIESTKEHLYHETNFVLKPHKGPKVVTVHDLSIHRYPEYHPKDRVAFMTKGMKRTMEKADQIITVSEFVKNEVIEHYSLDSDIVTAVPNAVDDAYRPRTEQQCGEYLRKYHLEYQRYLLIVGSVEPRKNLSLLLDSYRDLPDDTKATYPLIHIGPSGWKNTEIQSKANDLAASGCFRSLGYVEQSDLPYLLSGAAGLAFPSVYEGFGLPALEAIASGVPLLSSCTSALPEVIGEAGILIDPYSRTEITSGLSRLLDRGKPVEKMIEVGLARAKHFSWARTAKETYDVYVRAHH